MENNNYKATAKELKSATWREKSDFWDTVLGDLEKELDSHTECKSSVEQSKDFKIEKVFKGHVISLNYKIFFDIEDETRWKAALVCCEYDPIFDTPMLSNDNNAPSSNFEELTIWQYFVNFPFNKRNLMSDLDEMEEVESFLNSQFDEGITYDVTSAKQQLRFIKNNYGKFSGRDWMLLGQLIAKIENKSQKIYMGKSKVELIANAVTNAKANFARKSGMDQAKLDKEEKQKSLMRAAMIYAYSSGIKFKSDNDLAKQIDFNFAELCKNDSNLKNRLREIFTPQKPSASGKKKKWYMIPTSTINDHIKKFDENERIGLSKAAKEINLETAKINLIKALKRGE
ncbi:hypothetical protein [Pseudaquidulcibacter saccharophilus]|uniref:hypothetical protein n=1 Tax=Pseudaquidulcibacter saccharophilus TaxID=2831900 RepID=UPI001EFF50D5|nr:hypothetical protein [Pseudaquidulcibacter saccharophilus]